MLTLGEIERVLAQLDEPCRLMASLMYGAGLRLMECGTLRIKDVDIERAEITVLEAKGRRDRVTMLPQRHRADLVARNASVKRLHDADLAAGHGSVALPHALMPKYPRAA